MYAVGGEVRYLGFVEETVGAKYYVGSVIAGVVDNVKVCGDGGLFMFVGQVESAV